MRTATGTLLAAALTLGLGCGERSTLTYDSGAGGDAATHDGRVGSDGRIGRDGRPLGDARRRDQATPGDGFVPPPDGPPIKLDGPYLPPDGPTLTMAMLRPMLRTAPTATVPS